MIETLLIVGGGVTLGLIEMCIFGSLGYNIGKKVYLKKNKNTEKEQEKTEKYTDLKINNPLVDMKEKHQSIIKQIKNSSK